MSQKVSRWKYYHPSFDYNEDFKDYKIRWVGHIFFAYDLIRNLQPDTLVELGTYKGTSMYSFAQAVKDANLKTILYAVDCWEGDEQTGSYGDDVYTFVSSVIRKHYIEQNIRLVRKYFDEAVEEFKDKSIDILHIDGLHTYEAVKHDYETWKGKVKDDGVILFHDIKVADFGVWQVWEELKAEHPKSTIIEFKHNAGLGVLFKDPHVSTILSPDIIEDMIEYYKLKADQHINNVKNMEELWVMKKRAGALSNENDALSKIVRELEASKLVRLDRQARRIKNLFIK